MKVMLRIIEDDWDIAHELDIDGKRSKTIRSLSECPEDAIIGRDLVDGEDIINYIKMGYDAAKRGEELEITREVADEEFDEDGEQE